LIHHCSLQVRSYEVDGYNHVNNAVYLNYLEYARMEFLKAIGFDYRLMRERGYSLLVARVYIEYKHPAEPDDYLTIITTPIKKQKTSGVFKQTIWKGEKMICSAEVTWVCVDSHGRPVRIPHELDSPELNPKKEDIDGSIH